MTDKITGIYQLFIREIKLISKDFNIISIILLAPLFYSFFYGSIYFNKVENEVSISVIDFDQSFESKKFTRFIDAHPSVAITSKSANYSDGVQKINNFSAQALVLIPKNFESGLKSGKGSFLKIYLNTTKFLVSNDINKALNEVTATYSAGVKLKYFQAQGYSLEQSKEMLEPVKSEIRSLFNTTESYGDFLIPAILILIIQQTLLIGLSESIAKEKEENLYTDLFEKSNNSIWAIIRGKGLFYLILFSSYSLLFHTINFNVFALSFRGDVLSFILVTFLFILGVISLTFFIASFFNRKIVALQFLSITSYPVFLTSGYSWPFSDMPILMQVFSSLLPSTPYFTAYTRIVIMGGNIHNVLGQILHLVILNIFGLMLAWFRWKYIRKKELK